MLKKGFFQRNKDWLRSKIGQCPKNIEPGHKGFKSILKKSVHLPAIRFRECLMQIGMLCDENSMESFVENLCDLTKLTQEMSPTIVSFFENSFNETHFTKKISNIDWEKSSKRFKVIPKPKPILTTKAANLYLNKGVKAEDSEKIQNRLVFTKML